MKLKFKNQQFQTDAARAVADVFRGQRNQAMVEFTHDMGKVVGAIQNLFDVVGFRNQPVTVPDGQYPLPRDRRETLSRDRVTILSHGRRERQPQGPEPARTDVPERRRDEEIR